MYKKLAVLLALSMVLCGCDSSNLMNPEKTEPTQVTTVAVQSGLVSFEVGEVTVTQEDVKGSWTDAQTGTTLRFEGQNVVTIEQYVNGEYTAEQMEWTIDENGLSVTDAEGGKLDYKLVEKDGQIQIAGNGSVFTNTVDKESLLSQEIKFLGIGETATTDLVKLTLTGIEFATSVSLDGEDYLLPEPDGELDALPGDLLACLSFRVQNLMDEALPHEDFCNMVLEYDHNYRYWEGRYGCADGSECDIPAKTRVDCRAAIECLELVGEDNSTSLSISLTLPSSEGEVHFTYVLK